MIITEPDRGYFKLQSGSLTILIDPTNQRSFKGAVLALNTAKPARLAAGQAKTEPADSEPVWIEHQGEYEVKNIQVQGWSARGEISPLQGGSAGLPEKTVYRIIFEDFKILVLGDLDKTLEPDIQKEFQKPDIILGPANLKIIKWLKNLEPKLIIPALAKPSEIQEFLKEFGQKEGKPEEKLTLKLKDLESDKTIIRCLKP